MVIKGKERFRKIIENERIRAARNNNEFSLILLVARDLPSSRAAVMQVVRQVVCQLRDVDRIGWFDDYRIGILLPYTSRDGARKLVGRISRLFDSNITVKCEIYSYSDQAFVD